jgi:hypothetical protein
MTSPSLVGCIREEQGLIVPEHGFGALLRTRSAGLPDTRYAHLRDGEAGCFIARVDRAAGD